MATKTGAAVDLVVVGAGGHGLELAAYCEANENIRLAGMIDDGIQPGPRGVSRVLGGLDALTQLCTDGGSRPVHFIVAVGDNAVRKALVAKLEALRLSNLHAWTLTHGCSIGPQVAIGVGCSLAPGSIVTTAVRIGAHCIVNVNASISHDCVIGDFCNLNPGSVLCGNVTLGEGCYIGAGAVVKERITIGEWAIIGAGAVVVHDVPARSRAIGIPARATPREVG